MQKKIIALAVAAAASSAAFAQTNVTVYGIADLGQAFVKSSGAPNGAANQSTVGRLDNNSSYLGFKGTEDLGNGLKALFQFEVGYNADSGNSSTQSSGFGAGRDSFVGLTGGFGTVVAGNLTHPIRAFGAKADLMPAGAGLGTAFSLTGKIAGNATGADDRAANAIAYVSPTFSGFSGTVAYVNGEKQPAGSNTAEHTAYQVAAQYDNGPLFVGAGYHKVNNAAGVSTDDARIYRLVGVYTLPTATKLTALYDNTKADNNGGYDKRTAWSLGAAQSFGKNTVGLQYAKAGKIKDEDRKSVV